MCLFLKIDMFTYHYFADDRRNIANTDYCFCTKKYVKKV